MLSFKRINLRFVSMRHIIHPFYNMDDFILVLYFVESQQSGSATHCSTTEGI